jgi:tryptophanyl-tRNA synthetase
MSKSRGNAIPLAASDKEIASAVHAMYTDPGHLRVEDAGRVEGNVVFSYLDAFDPDGAGVCELKERYRRGGLGDGETKRRLVSVLKEVIGPIRERRLAAQRRPDDAMDVLRAGTLRARPVTSATLDEVRDVLGVFRLI